MASINDIGLAEPSTITKKVATVTINRNSTVMHQELLTLADAESSLGIARVLAAAPGSTEYGLVVRMPAANPVTVRSSAADQLVSVYQSTAADLNVTVGNASLITRSSAANMLVTAYQSTASALLNTVYQSTYTELQANIRVSDRDASTATAAVVNSTPASTAYGIVVRPAGGGVDYTNDGAVTASTVTGPACMFLAHSSYAAAVSADGDIVVGTADLRGRQQVTLAAVHPALANYSASTAANGSTLTVAVAASANLKNKVYAISVTSTEVTQQRVGIYAGSTPKWLVAWSSAVMGFNVAVTPPASLFATSTNEAVNFQVGGSSGQSFAVNVAYFQEP